ncbi:CDP-alcohol phosphatidyltransferase family protein [Stagnihabitans tardus]|uniref:CDP-alcohol phosphatidyltransferase family protein n=1 Tax=Stagnihabitans tardus TaxID=2699202 RepID=A0AAE4YA36_9RHOB|nr:CDP-alcohol phosphatidyltransferase family protein [Stagnihabitans tardus]NBZ88771.1 CDP-alcohol phosphatidyltransferase family protein [Stagnihabitans tardus]
MLDTWIRPKIDPGLNRAGLWLAARGVTANQVTALGLGIGLAAGLAVALGAHGLAAGLIILGRLADGLDGAIARAAQRRGLPKSDLGGYYDIVADFAFYAALPLGFAWGGDALPAAFLLAAFYINGASFLAFAILAEKRGIQTRAQGEKSLYYSAGLMEGTETIGFFLAMCLWPGAFAALALIFGTLCLVTAAGRVALAARVFRETAG